ncbi:MAG: L,D-transpeptidase/peptidoglycan binding protein, partial [Clostridiales bacterium]|nr:L,D-transpeptidase/peptidoglycan binding protein [Clostridiales bacterium]
MGQEHGPEKDIMPESKSVETGVAAEADNATAGVDAVEEHSEAGTTAEADVFLEDAAGQEKAVSAAEVADNAAAAAGTDDAVMSIDDVEPVITDDGGEAKPATNTVKPENDRKSGKTGKAAGTDKSGIASGNGKVAKSVGSVMQDIEPERKGLARLSLTQLRLLLAIEGLFAVLLVVYVGVGIYFTGHFFFNTTLNGMDVSRMSAEDVLQKEEEEIASYVLTIECRDGSVYTVSADEFSLQELWNDGISNLVKQQNALAWITSLMNDSEYTLEGTIVYDAEELEAALSELDFMKEENQVAAVDASISEYTELTGYTVVPSEEGTQINEDVLYSVLDAAFLALDDTVNLVESGCYIEPNITEDDETLNATVASLNAYASTTINYEIGELSQVLDGNTIKDWLVVAADGTVTVDESAVDDYVSQLSSTYNTCYSNKTLATSYGETVTITNIHYGWKVDEDAEKAQILEELAAGGSVTRDLNYSMTANSHTGNDYGNSYVEINLTAQHVFVYKDGVLVIDTDCVSGLSSSSDRITPTGAFTLTYKQKDATLKGDNYASHVDYWMPFYGNYGMHDASWRSKFGGVIYKTNGSHGCVNLPVSAAKTIYETIDKGWPVLIYNLAGTENNTAVKEAAEKVVNLINKISDTVTLDDEEAITNA